MPGSLGDLGGISYDIIAVDKTSEGVNSSIAGIARVTAAFATIATASTLINQATDAFDMLSQSTVLTADKLDVTKESVDSLVLDLADASFSVTDMAGAVDLLARSGEKFDDIRSIADTFKDMAEVSGQSATAVENQVIPALKAFKISVKDVGDYEDVFTSIQRDTTMSLGEFTGFISRSALTLQSLGLDIKGTAAVFEVLADKGIQGRQAMRVFSQAMQEQQELAKTTQTAMEKYTQVQEDLTKAQDEAAMSLEEYNIRMGYAGNDVAKARSLTMERQISLIKEQKKEQEALDKASEAKANVSAAQAAEKAFDPYKALGVSKEELQSKQDLIDSNKGLTDKLADLKSGYDTASAKAANAIDEARIAAGGLLRPIEDATVAIKELSYVMTIASAATGVLQGVGALKSGGSLAGGAGGIAGGLGKTAGTGGIAGGLGKTAAGGFSAGVDATAAAEASQLAKVGTMAEGIEAQTAFEALGTGGAAAGGSGAAGTSVGALALPALIGAALGGAVVFGLEKAGLLGLTGKGAVRSAGEVVGGTVYKAGYETADVAKVVINGGVQLSKDYDWKQFMKDMETYQNIKRMQKGL